MSPMMKQYLLIKEKYQNAMLFFRLGDFYEMFFEDAITASKVLELTLTGRDCGENERAPMCGVPYHAVDTYISKLIEKGYRVAICDQVSEPNGREIVQREVMRVVTAGTITESSMLDGNKNNYIVCLFYDENSVGVSWADISTGELNHLLIDNQIALKLNEILSRISPAEIICNSKMLGESINLSIVKFGEVCPFTAYNENSFDYDNALSILSAHLKSENLKILKKNSQCVCAAGALMSYINEMQKSALSHLKNSNEQNNDDYMMLDINARRTLELTKNSVDYKSKGSLLWLIDKTSTSMGSRLLKKWVEQPSINFDLINARLDMVEDFFNDSIACKETSQILGSMYDIERLTSRIACNTIKPKDCLSLSKSLHFVPELKSILNKYNSNLSKHINSQINCFNQVTDIIDSAIDENTTNNIKDGDIIKKGYNQKLDDYKNIQQNSLSIINQLEERLKIETGIKTLKISSNGVFGYFIEVPKGQINNVPPEYVRKQTLANAERYTIDELKILENKLVQAAANSNNLELELYKSLIEKLKIYVDDILSSAKNIAYLDCIVSLALVAKEYNYCKPIIKNDNSCIKIIEGRHAVVERLLKKEEYVPNDTLLDDNENKIMLITGPNMAGKSVYMRQVALICIMSHIGSFVPAKYAEIPIIDRIFTRIGASDDLSTGRSTFMVEMNEVSLILENITDKCLIILDEIGRGTSTYDGLSIAWSILEFLSTHSKAKTMFSTHYHELTDLEGVLPGIKNYKLTLREFKDSIIFLRKLMRGSANRSFGIEVAGLAGLPNDLIARAKELLKELEKADIARQTKLENQQLSIYNNCGCGFEIVKILKDIDLDNIAPRQALQILTDLIEKVKING